MKINGSARLICILLILSILFSACASTTLLNTTPNNAEVYIKNQKVGITPYSYTDRKIIGSSTMITFKKDGYQDYVTKLVRIERFNFGALLGAVVSYCVSLLWIASYDRYHYYVLVENIDTKPPFPDNNIAEINDTIPLGVEELLAQGNIEGALEYTEAQEGDYQSDCFFTIAGFYLGTDDYFTAEEFYFRSGRVNEGYRNISEYLMRGELIDSVLVIDSELVKEYLGKVFDNENDVLSTMAINYETLARESRDQNVEANRLKEMGMTSIQVSGDSIDINRALLVSQIEAISYFNSAVNCYDQLGNSNMVEELRNEIEVLDQTFLADRLLSQNEQEPNNSNSIIHEDDLIKISIDSVFTSAILPKDLRVVLNESVGISGAGILSRDNLKYMMVYYRITEKIKLNVGLNQPLPRITVVDKSGTQYRILLERGPAHIRVAGKGTRMWNPEESQKEGVIIDFQYMFFQMPEGAIPVSINYLYNYKDDPNSRKLFTREISIDLEQIEEF